MAKTSTKFLSVLLAVVMFFGMCTVLTACKDKSGNGTFTGLQIKYEEMLNQYADVFNNNGEVNVVYRNAQLNTLINTNSKFAKLGSNALYEPVLNAGIRIFCYYTPKLDMEKVSISGGYASDLDKAFEKFKGSLSAFITAKTNLENREEINGDGVIEQSLLAILCDKYKQLVDDGCILGQKFSALYHANIFEDYEPKDGQRYPVGKMKMFVLDKLNEFAVLEYENRIAYYHDKEFTNPTKSNCVDVLKAFNKVKNIALWEGSEATISNNEKQILNIFGNLLDYDVIYQQAIQNCNYALSKTTLSQYYKFISGTYERTEFNNQELVYLDNINEFFSVSVVNVINYITKLCDKVYAFKTA